MPLTNGNIYNRKKDYHIFTNEEASLGMLGLNGYTYSSIDNLKQSLPSSQNQQTTPNPILQEFESYFDLTQSNTDPKIDFIFQKLLCSGTPEYVSKPKIMHFDKDSLTYIEQSVEQFLKVTEDCDQNAPTLPTNIPDFLKAYNKAIFSRTGVVDGYKASNIIKIAQKIQNSLSGCISFSVKYKAAGCERIVPIKLRLLEKEKSNDSRIIATRGAPVIAGIPQRVTGGQYSMHGTDNSPIGVYQNPNEGGLDNPKNTVAGELDIRFNKTTGKWQSGTHQVLVRLITDVDSAKVGTVNNSILSGPSLSSASQTYNPNSNSYVGQFTTGSGVPLSMENGNPYMYGPNFIGCADNVREVEKIPVVNRSNRSFKAGEVVMASNIDGEWLIQGFDLPTSSDKRSSTGPWQFQKFIVTSDGFFKDNVFSIQNITPNIYESKMRKKYYAQGLNANTRSPALQFLENSEANFLCRSNFYINESVESAQILPSPATDDSVKAQYRIELNNKYFQTTSFDQLDTTFGGTNPLGNVIGRTNIFASPTGSARDSLGFIYQIELAHFWGAVFPNGYTSKSVELLKSKSEKEKFKFKINNTNRHKFLTSDQKPAWNSSKDSVLVGMFSDSNDNNFLQLPADVALNGPPISGLAKAGKFSSPIEYINITAEAQNNLQQYFYDKISGNDKERYSYLKYETQHPDPNLTNSSIVVQSGAYDLTPINPNIIQFSPLQLQTALSLHQILKTDPEYISLKTEIVSGRTRPFKDNFITDHVDNQLIIFPQNFLDRNNLQKNTLQFTRIRSDTGEVTKVEDIAKGPFGFGPCVEYPKDSVAPAGGPQIIPKENLPDEKSNIVGIIAAKNTFSAGSLINFTTKQEFGLPKRVTVTGAGSIAVTILGPFLSWATGTGGDVTQRGFPQWGDKSRTDNIDSFGTTSLHVRIFDEWPDNQTFFDGRYFSVLHFNPTVEDTGSTVSPSTIERLRCTYGPSFKSARRENTVLIAKIEIIENNTAKTVDKYIIETSVDFTEPTKEDGKIVTEGESINSSTKLLSQEYWHINPCRRGALLTGGGFRYRKKVIGLNQSGLSVKINTNPIPGESPFMGGEGYKVGDIINFPRGATAKIPEGGVGPAGNITQLTLVDKGEGFLPRDFPVSSTGGGSGTGAVFECSRGIVYYAEGIDQGPQERCPITRLTPSSNNGDKIINSEQKTSIALDGNGKYDAFYFMHNDILHTLLFDSLFSGGFAQYIRLEIT